VLGRLDMPLVDIKGHKLNTAHDPKKTLVAKSFSMT
jgi:hypothetical protein